MFLLLPVCRVLILKTVRIWYPVCQGPLTQDGKDKGIGVMILAEVQLEDPSSGYAPMYPSHRPAGAVLVDLVVLPEHTATVRSKYLPVNFAPFSGHDTLVCSEPGGDIDLKRALALEESFQDMIKHRESNSPGVKCRDLRMSLSAIGSVSP